MSNIIKLFSYMRSLHTNFCGVDALQKDGILYSDEVTIKTKPMY